jgi:hypothetical protein
MAEPTTQTGRVSAMTNNVASPAKTLRPSGDLYKKAVRRDLWVAIPVLLLVTGSQIGLLIGRARINGDEGVPGLVWMYVGLLVAGLAFSVIYYFSLMRNLRVVIEATGLTTVNGAGRVREIAYSGVGTVIQALLRFPGRTMTMPMLFLLDHNGKRIYTMYGTVFTPEAMLAVGAATNVAPTTFAAPTTYRELRTLYPHGFGWARANPVGLAAIVAGGIFLLFIIVMVVLFVYFTSTMNA